MLTAGVAVAAATQVCVAGGGAGGGAGWVLFYSRLAGSLPCRTILGVDCMT